MEADLRMDPDPERGPDLKMEADPGMLADPGMMADPGMEAGPRLEADPGRGTDLGMVAGPRVEADPRTGDDIRMEVDPGMEADPEKGANTGGRWLENPVLSIGRVSPGAGPWVEEREDLEADALKEDREVDLETGGREEANPRIGETKDPGIGGRDPEVFPGLGDREDPGALVERRGQSGVDLGAVHVRAGGEYHHPPCQDLAGQRGQLHLLYQLNCQWNSILRLARCTTSLF